jgi:hypothetical protein
LFSGVLAIIYAANFGCVMALADSLSGKPVSKAKPTLERLSTLVIFPVDNEAGDDASGAALRLWNGIRMKINDAGRFRAVGFTTNIKTVDRALNVDDTLTSADVTGPFDGPEKAGRITSVIAGDMESTNQLGEVTTSLGYVTTVLTSENIDTVKNSVEVTAKATVYANGYDDPIGEITVKGVAYSVAKSDDLTAVETRAIDSASGKIAQFFSPVTSTGSAIPKPHSVKSSSNVLLWILAGVVAGVAYSVARSRTDISSGSTSSTTTSSSSSSSSSSTPTVPSAPSL